MKTKVVKPEVVNKHIGAAVMMVLKALHNIEGGIRVVNISSEGTDLDPTGVNYVFKIEVQISGDPPELAPEIKNTPL